MTALLALLLTLTAVTGLVTVLITEPVRQTIAAGILSLTLALRSSRWARRMWRCRSS